MSANLAALLYLGSGILFILALRGLSSPETARQGNYYGMAGMALAVATPLLAVDIDANGVMQRRRILADVSEGDEPGAPDGVKVDSLGRVYCTGPGGIWVIEPDGRHIGTIRLPEQAVNFTFGGSDLRTLFVTAVTSVYTLRMKTPGQPHPWYRHYGA